ncbi:MAG: hypothetical protein IJS46_05790 [Kiritimatiellae bacterium]|nr:hypothetical protein [Kiritimatiellia bacterium]
MGIAVSVRRRGQAYFETLLAVLVLLAALFGALQTVFLYGEHVVLHHAAARAARAKTVGFNDWMAQKAAHVAAIPFSGRILGEKVGAAGDGAGASALFESARIPEYLAAENRARAEYVLDYEEWEGGRFSFFEQGGDDGRTVCFAAVHDAPVFLPFGFLAVPGAGKDEDGTLRFPVAAEGVAPDHAWSFLEGSR